MMNHDVGKLGSLPLLYPTGFSTHRPQHSFRLEKTPSRGILFRAIEPFNEFTFVSRLSSIV
jgi:hypothetical protein